MTEPRAADAGPRHRAFTAFACLALGLIIARACPAVPSLIWFSLCCACGAVAIVARHHAARVALGLMVLTLGAGSLALRVHERDADNLLNLLPDEAQPALVDLDVLVTSPPLLDPGRHDPLRSGQGLGPSTRFDALALAARTDAGPLRVTGLLRVSVRELLPELSAGDRLRARGVLIPPEAPLNPGQFDPRLWAAQDGRVGRLIVESSELLAPVAEAGSWSLRARALWARALGALRGFASAALDSALSDSASPDGRALLGALLLGRDETRLAPIEAAFARLGVVHVLSISGFHLVVIAGVALGLIRLLGGAGRAEPALLALVVLVYLLIVPAEAPVLRAGFALLALLGAEALGRRHDRLALLAWLGCALLLHRPLDLWNPGFQLSLGLCAVLLALGRSFHAALFAPRVATSFASPASLPRDRAEWTWRRIAAHSAGALFATNLLAWSTSAPLIAYHAGLFSPFAWLSGLLLVPCFTLALWLGFLVILLGAAGSLLGALPGVDAAGRAAGLPGAVLGVLGDWSLAATNLLDAQPGMAWSVPALSPLWAAGATALTLAWFTPARQDAPDRAAAAIFAGPRSWGVAISRHRAVLRWWAAAVLLAWLALALLRPALGPPATGAATGGSTLSAGAGVDVGGVRVDSFALSSGSATLVRSGGDALLWSCGSEQPDAPRRTLPRALRELGAWRVRSVVVPSAQPRDFLGLAELLPQIEARDLFIPAGFEYLAGERPGSPHEQLLDAARLRGLTIHTLRDGDQLVVGSARVLVAAPAASSADITATFAGAAPRTTASPARARPHAPALAAVIILDRDHPSWSLASPRAGPEHDAAGSSEADDAAISTRDTPGAATGIDGPPAIVLAGSFSSADALALVDRLPARVLALHAPASLSSAAAAKLRTHPGLLLWQSTPAPGLAERAQRPPGLQTGRDGAVWVELAADGACRAGSLRAGPVERVTSTRP